MQALAGLGWTDGRNVRIDLRYGSGDSNRIRALAQELVGLQPDIILASGTAPTKRYSISAGSLGTSAALPS
jgi:putative ABC transport system substrate-binding protein